MCANLETIFEVDLKSGAHSFPALRDVIRATVVIFRMVKPMREPGALTSALIMRAACNRGNDIARQRMTNSSE
jgi:hypothetical protein